MFDTRNRRLWLVIFLVWTFIAFVYDLLIEAEMVFILIFGVPPILIYIAALWLKGPVNKGEGQ